MFSWRRKAKAERENVISSERLHDLVNQALLSNFGPLGSYAIARRSASDCDDIFHTMLASSVARNIVSSLIEHKVVIVADASLPSALTPEVPQPSVPKPSAPKPAPPRPSSYAPASLAPIDVVPVPPDLAAAVSELSLGRDVHVTHVAISLATSAPVDRAHDESRSRADEMIAGAARVETGLEAELPGRTHADLVLASLVNAESDRSEDVAEHAPDLSVAN
ncbi:hypothetical protein KPL76_06965 [Subtercola sp. PAMC28395]|uniref:hypothetical protein n=1 Tax=Subtercola sp. PAMC28395 TaxID=2846775 RepID=UPI001C0E8024|nr:hypothetical protein [Subtercola sp. PAMC28395]QWT25080.1 hypothetical protein KPL76_06965 [Subtercola sp. PAMC28395]